MTQSHVRPLHTSALPSHPASDHTQIPPPPSPHPRWLHYTNPVAEHQSRSHATNHHLGTTTQPGARLAGRSAAPRLSRSRQEEAACTVGRRANTHGCAWLTGVRSGSGPWSPASLTGAPSQPSAGPHATE